jgi:hypothetical protein
MRRRLCEQEMKRGQCRLWVSERDTEKGRELSEEMGASVEGVHCSIDFDREGVRDRCFRRERHSSEKNERSHWREHIMFEY